MSLRALSTFVRASAATLFVCGLAASASAQNTPAGAQAANAVQQSSQQPSQQTATTADKPTAEEADLSITARVTAREVLFRKVPNPKVEFPGKPERRTLWESERQNLPDEVQPGVTYRDVGITLRIVSVFADIDRIVAEALGEIPLSDDATPATDATPPANASPPVNTPPPADATPPANTSPPVSISSPAARAPSDNPRRAARRTPESARRARTARTQP